LEKRSVSTEPNRESFPNAVAAAQRGDLRSGTSMLATVTH